MVRIKVKKCMSIGNALVSKTWITFESSGLDNPKVSPPKTNTRVPDDAIACPERPAGLGPIFWKVYHR